MEETWGSGHKLKRLLVDTMLDNAILKEQLEKEQYGIPIKPLLICILFRQPAPLSLIGMN